MVEVVAALIWEENRFLICQRPANKARRLLWEFPGGKIEPGESPEYALKRECREELGIEITVDGLFYEVNHTYPDLTIHLRLYSASILRGPVQKLEHNDIRFIFPSSISEYEFCPADKEILQEILNKSIPISDC